MPNGIEAAAGRRPAFIFVFISVLLDIVSIGIVIPVMPRLIQSFLPGDLSRAALVFGVFMTLWAVMQFFFSPLMGALSDRFGRRPVILGSNLALGVDYAVMAFAPTLPILFLGRLVSGAASATIATAHAYIADITAPDKRAGAFGMMGAAFGVGFVLGPAVGGVLGAIDLRYPFMAAAAMSLANFLYGWFVLPESLKPENRAPFRPRAAHPLGAVRLLSRDGALARLGAVAFLMQFAHHALPACSVLFMGYRFGWAERETGLALAFVGVCTLIVQGGLVKPLVGALGERRAMMAGLAAGAAGFIIYGVATNGAVFLVGVPVMAFWGLVQPSAASLMTARVEPTEQGRLQGATASLTGLSGMVAPFWFSWLFAIGVDPASIAGLPGLPFFAAALMLAAGIAIAASLRIDRANPAS